MIFAHPTWLWLVLAAPLVALGAALCWRRRLAAAAAWAARSLWDRLFTGHRPGRALVSSLLLALVVAAILLALAQPRWGSSEQTVERQGVDVVFVLDTSLSMATRDVQPSRLWVAQTLIRRLVRQLTGHRVALVQAEGDGVVMVPLTSDAAVIDLLLDGVLPGSLPTPGTELTPGVERALELFPDDEGKHRVVVLVSDGEDHGSGLDRLADQLRDTGTVLNAIGVGTRDGMPLEVPATEGSQTLEYKRDEQGNVVVSRLMEEPLESLARASGGVYLRADGAATELAPLIERIEGMERRSYGSEVINTLEERFQWPLALAVASLLALLAFAPFDKPRWEGGR